MQTNNMSKLITVDYEAPADADKSRIIEVEAEIEEKKTEHTKERSKEDLMARAHHTFEKLSAKSDLIKLATGMGYIKKEDVEGVKKQIDAAILDLENIIKSEA